MNDQNISVLEESRDKFWPSAASVAKKLVIWKREDKKNHGNQKKNRTTGEAETRCAYF